MHALILMSDTGGGHRALSLGIKGGLEASTAVPWRVTLVDPFATEDDWFPPWVMSCYGPVIRRAPWLYGLFFRLVDGPANYMSISRVVATSVVERTANLVLDHDADVVVIAHPLAIAPALDAIDDVRQRWNRVIPTVAMVTELATVHRTWIDRRATRHLAATDIVRRGLEARGIHPDRIVETGLPVGPEFGGFDESVSAVRVRLRLMPNTVTALIVAGGEGTGPVERLVSALARDLPDLQLIVVCGRNERLKARIEGACMAPSVVIYGFVTNMAELMHASDFILTKGGPQSISECLASARPTIVTNMLPGQEQGNGAYVTRAGVGFLALTIPDMVAAARRLAHDPARRRQMAEAASALGCHESSARAAQAIEGVMGVRVAASAGN
jgi:1,2-diacylglycerol 3-beta-galactosyltransferase